jgi:hypothetical protein
MVPVRLRQVSNMGCKNPPSDISVPPEAGDVDPGADDCPAVKELCCRSITVLLQFRPSRRAAK